MTEKSPRIRLYRLIIQPLQPRIYAVVARLVTWAGSSGAVYSYHDGELLRYPPPETEREAGQIEWGVKSVTTMLLLLPAIYGGYGVFAFRDLSALWWLSVAVCAAMGTLALASTRGLDIPELAEVGGESDR